jgi:hypothetical protein
VGLCILLSLPGNNWVDVPAERWIVGGVVFCAVHLVWKESRRSLLSRSCSGPDCDAERDFAFIPLWCLLSDDEREVQNVMHTCIQKQICFIIMVRLNGARPNICLTTEVTAEKWSFHWTARRSTSTPLLILQDLYTEPGSHACGRADVSGFVLILVWSSRENPTCCWAQAAAVVENLEKRYEGVVPKKPEVRPVVNLASTTFTSILKLWSVSSKLHGAGEGWIFAGAK